MPLWLSLFPDRRRYLDLQHALMDLSVEVNLQRDASASIPSVENLDTRKRVLGFWLPIVFIHAMYGPGRPIALWTRRIDHSAGRGAAARCPGATLCEDFPQFEQFLNSASFEGSSRLKKPPNMSCRSRIS